MAALRARHCVRGTGARAEAARLQVEKGQLLERIASLEGGEANQELLRESMLAQEKQARIELLRRQVTRRALCRGRG